MVILEAEDGTKLTAPVKQYTEHYKDPEEEFNLIDYTTGNVVGKMKYKDFFGIMYSASKHIKNKNEQ